MVYVKGGTTKNVHLMALAYDNAKYAGTTKAGREFESQWLDVQMMQTEGANPNQPRQLNPSLNTTEKVGKDGKKTYDSSVAYTASPPASNPDGKSQMDLIREAAGDNVRDLLNKDGEAVGKVYMFSGDIMLPGKGPDGRDRPGLVNTKNPLNPLPADVPIPDDPYGAQIEAVSANREEHKKTQEARKSQQVEAPQAEAQGEQEAPAAEMEEPQM